MVSRKDLTTVVFFLSYVQELLISFLHCGAVFASNMVSSTVHTASHHPDVDALYSRTYDETEREVFPWGFRIISCVTSRITSSIPVIKTPICSLTSFFFFHGFMICRGLSCLSLREILVAGSFGFSSRFWNLERRLLGSWAMLIAEGWNFPLWKFLDLPEAGKITFSLDYMSFVNILLINAIFV